jgi:hypothetical protein
MQLENCEHEIIELRKTQDSPEQEECDQLLTQLEDEVETLADHAGCHQLGIEGIQRRSEAESIEQSESCSDTWGT